MIARVREGLQTPDEPTVTSTTAVPAAVASSGLMLLLLALTYFLSYYDRLVMVVVGEMVKTEFALSDKQLSLLTGASFVVIYGICGIAAGWLVDHYSRKRVMIWSLLLWSFLTAACGMAKFVHPACDRAGRGRDR
jgi:MFS family permease